MTDLELEIYDGLTARLGITWETDDATRLALGQSVRASMALLRSIAGNDQLDFGRADLADLAVTGAWYIHNNHRAEFLQDYLGELNVMRLTEAFGCGESEDTSL